MEPSEAAGPVRLFVLGPVEARQGGVALAGLMNQPKRLALLLYLALSPRGSARRRDDLLAMFFPDSSDTAARNALNQTVYRLRAVLGEEALVGGEQELRLDTDQVRCDAVELQEAAAAGDDARVVALYRGPLAEAFHARALSNEFESWLAQTRSALRDLALTSALRESDAQLAANNLIGALDMSRLAERIDPLSQEAVLRRARLLERAGDVAGALRVLADYGARLQRELDLEPSAAIAELEHTLRTRPRPVVPSPDLVAPDPAMPATPGSSATQAPIARPHRTDARTPRRLAGAAAGALLLAVLVAAILLNGRDEAVPVLAVGEISAPMTGDSTLPVALLLSTSLARVEGLAIVTEDRVREVAALRRRAGREPDVRRGAFAAGADEVIEGVLSRRGDYYRLDFRRVDRAGRASAGHLIEAGNLVDLVDLAAEQIAADLGLIAPAARAAGRSASLVAYRLYEQGLDALYADDRAGAGRLFRAAFAEDTTFAMAAFHLASITSEEREAIFKTAYRLAASSPERERLFIQASVLQVLGRKGSLAVAESLATRYPENPEGLMEYGGALMQNARFLEAIDVYRRAALIDSLSNYDTLRCRACEARRRMRVAYLAVDSADAVVREARAWLDANPTSARAWSELGQALEIVERFDEAEQAFARARGSRYVRDADHMTGVWIRQRRFDVVDAHWANELRTGDEEARKSAYWGSFISFRTQGRLEEALASARGFRELHGDPLLEGLALHELGRYRESAHAFEQLAAPWRGSTEPNIARRVAWHLAHAAASYAALRDTVTLRAIEDTVRAYTVDSGSAADQRLHHYIRGLRMVAAGRPAEAVPALEASLVSPFGGYVRQSLELARAHVHAGDPRRAVQVLRSALYGPVSAAGLYASRTELLELLGEAYERSGQPDSAAIAYASAIASWRNADPVFAPRVRQMQERLATIRARR